jgi:HSP20 family protein
MANALSKQSDSQSLQATEYDQAHFLVPAADILENDEHYLVLADMPGVDPADIEIELEAERLSIAGTVKSLSPPVMFRRVFQVGNGVDPNGISAQLKNGVLHLTARKNQALRPRRITVQAN